MKTGKKLISLLLAAVIALSCAAVFSSCGEQSDYPVKIGDITIEKEPSEVVVLDQNLADVISAIGYSQKLVGRSSEVNRKGVSLLPSVGSQYDPCAASIDELGARLVLTATDIESKLAEEITKGGAEIITLEPANTPKQLNALYKKLGTILGGNVKGAAKAEKAYKEIFSTMKDVKTSVQSYSVVKTACFLHIDNGVLKTAAPGTWAATMLDYTGAVNVFKNSDSDVVDTAELKLSNPDYIFAANKTVVHFLKTSETLSGLKALNGNTYIISCDEMNMQGFGALETLKKMTANMYPED